MKDAGLDVELGGQFEVRLYGEPDEYGPLLLRRRHVDDVKVAEGMIATWLDGTEAMWDRAYGIVGTREEWLERTHR